MSVAEKIIFSNVRSFYAIAKESFNEVKAEEKKNTRPKPNGESGYIKTFDPNQKGFKNALVTIVFCGVCLESLLHLLIGKRLGPHECKKTDNHSYKEKVILLGCQDKAIIDGCEHFRKCRKEIVHEKAYFDKGGSRIAQTEAAKAIELLDSICQFFKIKLS